MMDNMLRRNFLQTLFVTLAVPKSVLSWPISEPDIEYLGRSIKIDGVDVKVVTLRKKTTLVSKTNWGDRIEFYCCARDVHVHRRGISDEILVPVREYDGVIEFSDKVFDFLRILSGLDIKISSLTLFWDPHCCLGGMLSDN